MKPNRKLGVSSVYDFAAIGVQDLAADVRGIGGGEKNVAGGDFHWFARAVHGGGGTEFGNLFPRKGGGDERRPNRTGSDAIYTDALVHQFAGERTGKGNDGAFGSGVINQHRVATISSDRCAVDDG